MTFQSSFRLFFWNIIRQILTNNANTPESPIKKFKIDPIAANIALTLLSISSREFLSNFLYSNYTTS